MNDKTVLAACPHDCPDTCSMLMQVKDGRLAAVRGNPDHPFTRGRLCVKVNNYEQRVHSPERVLYPMRRVGRKGSADFTRIPWHEALEEIATRWHGLIQQHGAQCILPYSYLGTQGILNGLSVGDPFFNRLGATISERTFCDSGASTAYTMTLGPTAGLDPERFVDSRCIILWACNSLATNSHHWPFIAEAQRNGAKVIVIDPVRTRTAAAADWHIPIRPGTDAALALSLIHVLITENLTDDDYIERYTLGFDDLKARADNYDPETVAGITGVPAADIRRLAQDYARGQPSAIRIGVAIERHPGGGQAVRAISSLPALTGSWRHAGGGILQLTLWAYPVEWDRLSRPDLIQPGTRVLNQWKLGAALTGELPLDPAIQSLFVYNANPLAMVSEQAKIRHGLARDDLFTVVSEQFVTDTARYADLLLPATTQAEQVDLMFSWGHLYLQYSRQALPALGEAVSNSELFRRLAGAMGYTDPVFFRDDQQQMADAIDWSAPVLQGVDLNALQDRGYVKLALGNSAPHAAGGFATASGKCEFKSSAAENGDFVLPVFRQGYTGQQAGTTLDPVPNYIPPRESAHTDPTSAHAYPLSLISPKSHALLNSTYGNLPHQRRHAGDPYVLINPRDAAARAIDNAQAVKVANDRGAFFAEARISDATMPGVIVAPSGFWPQFSRGGATVNAVLDSTFADMGHAPTFSDVHVEVETVFEKRDLPPTKQTEEV